MTFIISSSIAMGEEGGGRGRGEGRGGGGTHLYYDRDARFKGKNATYQNVGQNINPTKMDGQKVEVEVKKIEPAEKMGVKIVGVKTSHQGHTS